MSTIYDDIDRLSGELWDFSWFQRQLNHQELTTMVANRRRRWDEFCEEYKTQTGKVFLHSAITLQRLRLLHDIHDERDPDYCGVIHGPPVFDWTYALPFFTDSIRLTGATEVEWSLKRRAKTN